MIKNYQYKVYRGTTYLGMLPKPKSEFEFPQEINSAGSMITIDVPMTVDTSYQTPPQLVAEDGVTLLVAEDNTTQLIADRVQDAIGDGANNALLRLGNEIKVYEFSDYWPNGKIMFSGNIQHLEAAFGDSTDEIVTAYVYSDGQDLNNYVIAGSTSLFIDQSQATQNDSFSIYELGGGGGRPVRMGQTYTIGSTVSNIAQIKLLLDPTFNQTYTLNVWSAPTEYNLGHAPLATATAATTGGGATQEVTFTFSSPLAVLPSSQIFFSIQASPSSTLSTAGGVYLLDSNISGGNAWLYGLYTDYTIISPNALYFKTYYSTLTTTRVFSTQDPSTMLKTIIDEYVAQGGLVNYSTGTVDLTGLSVPDSLQLATVYEGIQEVLNLSGNNYYWYVDLGTNTLYFKQKSTTADFRIIKGRHLDKVKLVFSSENIKNKIFFSGGNTGGGLNLFKTYTDVTSITNYGLRLDRISNNRITTTAPADATGNAYIASNKDPQQQTVITIPANTMDITLLKPGKTISFRGFGTFVDSLIIQIVRIDYTPDAATLTLGVLPPRLGDDVQQALDDINALQTIDNPNSPS